MEPKTLHCEGEVKVVAAATDFSPVANAAVRRAALICRARTARLHLVHVLRPAGANTSAVLTVLAGRRRLSPGAAVSHLRQAAARVVAEFGVQVDTHLGIGNVSREIAALAQTVSADLVVLGNAPRRFLAEVLGISTALRVQRKTDIPVLAVSNAVTGHYNRILLAADLSPGAARAGQRMRRLFPSILRVDHGHPALSARAQVHALDVDVVVLRPTRGWLKTGVTDHLLADPPCDVLLMPQD